MEIRRFWNLGQYCFRHTNQRVIKIGEIVAWYMKFDRAENRTSKSRDLSSRARVARPKMSIFRFWVKFKRKVICNSSKTTIRKNIKFGTVVTLCFKIVCEENRICMSRDLGPRVAKLNVIILYFGVEIYTKSIL